MDNAVNINGKNGHNEAGTAQWPSVKLKFKVFYGIDDYFILSRENLLIKHS